MAAPCIEDSLSDFTVTSILKHFLAAFFVPFLVLALPFGVSEEARLLSLGFSMPLIALTCVCIGISNGRARGNTPECSFDASKMTENGNEAELVRPSPALPHSHSLSFLTHQRSTNRSARKLYSAVRYSP